MTKPSRRRKGDPAIRRSGDLIIAVLMAVMSRGCINRKPAPSPGLQFPFAGAPLVLLSFAMIESSASRFGCHACSQSPTAGQRCGGGGGGHSTELLAIKRFIQRQAKG